jgi:hypothetical protein
VGYTCENGFNHRPCPTPASVLVEVKKPSGWDPLVYRLCHYHLGLLLKRVLGQGAVVEVTYIGEVYPDDFA